MQYVAVFVTQYNSSLSSFVPNFRIRSQVVAEKSLTEKKSLQKDRQTVTEKAKTIYPQYTLYAGGIISIKLLCLYLVLHILPHNTGTIILYCTSPLTVLKSY